MAKDFYHTIVREALERDGWKITHDPFIIKSERLNARVEIDLALEKTLIAEKDTPAGIRSIMVDQKFY
ncbi:MAG: hypothetical protein RIS64_2668 [Bacteroidota bacterium]|jgi:hypothetical protein